MGPGMGIAEIPVTASLGKADSKASAMRAGEKYVPWVLLTPAMLIMTIVGIFPLLHSLYISFTSMRPTEIDKPQGFVGLDNYIHAFADPQFGHSLLLTGLFTLLSVAIALVFAVLLAVLFNLRLPGFLA